MHPPEQPVSARDFMPSYQDPAVREEDLSEEEIEQRDAFNLAVLIEAQRQREQQLRAQ